MGKWKRKARELEAENQEMDRCIANLRLDLDDRNRMIDVLYAGRRYGKTDDMRQWTALVASDALTCSGIAWDVCGPGPWYARDANVPHPCGVLS